MRKEAVLPPYCPVWSLAWVSEDGGFLLPRLNPSFSGLELLEEKKKKKKKKRRFLGGFLTVLSIEQLFFGSPCFSESALCPELRDGAGTFLCGVSKRKGPLPRLFFSEMEGKERQGTGRTTTGSGIVFWGQTQRMRAGHCWLMMCKLERFFFLLLLLKMI